MTKEKLIQLHNLISEWIMEPNWNIGSGAWENIVETQRQVKIDIRAIDQNWDDDEPVST